jgi:hypothetical protein
VKISNVERRTYNRKNEHAIVKIDFPLQFLVLDILILKN